MGRQRTLKKLEDVARIWAQSQSATPVDDERAEFARQMGLPEDRVAIIEQRNIARTANESVTVWPENATIVFHIWPEVCRYWDWLNTGSGLVQHCLDWARISSVTLAYVPKIFARPDLKKKKQRFLYIKESLQTMEAAAVKVFMAREKERMEEMKRERKHKTPSRASVKRR